MQDRILVVDDDISFSNMIADYLRSKDYHVTTADHMDQAIRICKKDKPKVVLLDFKMPLITGEELLPLLQGVNPEAPLREDLFYPKASRPVPAWAR